MPPLDRWRWSVALARTAAGKLLLIAVATLLLMLLPTGWIEMAIPAVLAFTFLPRWRPPILLASGATFWLAGPAGVDWALVDSLMRRGGLAEAPLGLAGRATLLMLALGTAAAILWLARRDGLWRRAPLALTLGLILLTAAVASYAPMPDAVRAAMFALAVVFSAFIWFLGYSLLDRFRPGGTALSQMAAWQPFWGGGAVVPYPKGPSHLGRILAATPEEMAITQLKGLKLLYWALLLQILLVVLQGALFGRAALPGGLGEIVRDGPALLLLAGDGAVQIGLLPDWLRTEAFWSHFRRCLAGPCGGTGDKWLALGSYFFMDLLYTAVRLHMIVGVARLCGYRALRGSWRPLQARSIADFWNRYNYYFKELLAQLFYFPVFMRWFKHRPLLRLYAALIAAVCLGNVLLHLLQHWNAIVTIGLLNTLAAFHVYVVYSLILAHAIFLSQLRLELRPGPRGRFERIVVTPVVVLGFYGLLLVFADPGMQSGGAIDDHAWYFLSLFGVGPWAP